MAFGGYFNPNYTLLPNQQGPSPQLPPSPQGPMPPPPMPQIPQYQQPTFGDMFSMPFMSMPFMQYLGGGLSSKPPSATTAPQVPQVPQVTAQPPQVPTVPTAPAPINKPGLTQAPTQAPASPSLPYIPNTGVYGQPGQYAAPNPGNNSMGLPPTPTPTSGQDAYDQEVAYYNSPQYAAYWNSLAPSTRAFMHAPGNATTANYLGQQAQDNYNAFGNNVPWVPNR